MQSRQATSLRVDQVLYDRLARLARDRGTSITRQLEMAIRGHLEAAVVQDHLPVMQPVLERIVTAHLEATVTAKIDEVKERLASLLARNAMDTAVLYLMNTNRFSDQELAAWRKAAADHVRGRLAEITAKPLATEEMERLKKQVESLTNQLQKKEKALADAQARHEKETDRLEAKISDLRDLAHWYERFLRIVSMEMNSGLLVRRRTFTEVLRDHEKDDPRPNVSVSGL